MDKKCLRSRAKEVRESVSKDYRLYSQEAILYTLKSLLQKYQNVSSYISIQTEISTHLINEWIFLEKKLILPKVNEDELEFYQVNSLHEGYVQGAFNLREPNPTEATLISSDHVDAFLIPGLVFDREGHRIGYGKGYYDKALKNAVGVKIGVAFECQLFEQVIQDEHDIQLDYVVTEKKLYKCKKTSRS